MYSDFRPPTTAFEPLENNANATLFFTTSQIITDPTTGQLRIGRASSNVREFRAIVHENESPTSPTDRYSQGKDQKIIEIRGRLTDPKIFPSDITHLSEGEIEIDGLKGKFTLKLYPQNPYVKGELGQQFYGLFQPN
ncbi:MAG: hypothetical protein QNJ38_01245 [Prochloraceae cyanobacterium]|nr:hypothetical protein [Prochloraceae cyanobacterium]